MMDFAKTLPKMRMFAVALFLLLCPVALTGCLSHLFDESETRLQVENATEDYTILAIDIVALEGSDYLNWINGKLLPGERSKVVERDWIGEFKARIKFTESKDGKGEVLEDFHMFDFEGGSMFLMIEASGDSLNYRFR